MDGRSVYPLPDNTAPTGERCLQVTIPDDDQYQTLLLSAVDVLSFWMNYDRDDMRSGALVANVFKKVMASWKDCAGKPISLGETLSEDFDMSIHVDCDCNVTIDCCDGTTKQLATVDMINQSSQPGSGTPQPSPGGGTQCYPMRLDASKKFFIPFPLSSGDTVQVGLPGQALSGSANDGTDTTLYCGNGSVYNAGICSTGGSHTVSTDPKNTSPHMSLLFVINGVYYPIADNTVTVPGGISLQTGYIQENTDNLAVCSGEITGNVCVVNHQAVTWGRRYDFRIASYGWIPEDVGTWVAGVGFVGAFQNSASQVVTSPGFAFPSTSATKIDLTYNKSSGSGANDEAAIYASYPSGGVLVNDSGVHGTGIHLVWNGPSTETGITVSVNSGTDPSSIVNIVMVDIYGVGAIPPGGVPI